MTNINDNPLFYIGLRQEQIIVTKFRVQCSYLNGYLYSTTIIDFPAYSCEYVNENILFLLVGPLYNRPRDTIQKRYGAHSTLYPKNSVVWR